MGYNGNIQWDTMGIYNEIQWEYTMRYNGKYNGNIQWDTMGNTIKYNGNIQWEYTIKYNEIQWEYTMLMMVWNMVYMVYIFVTGFSLSYSFPV